MDDSGSSGRTKHDQFVEAYENARLRARLTGFAWQKLNRAKSPEHFVEQAYDTLFQAFIVKDQHIENIPGWLFAVVRNRVYDFLRQLAKNKQQGVENTGDLLDFTLSFSPDETGEPKILSAAEHQQWNDTYSKQAYLNAASAPLPLSPRQVVGFVLRRSKKEHRKFIVWSILWELSVIEIVEMTGEPPKIVRARCNRARNHFRARMKKFLGVV
jgi:DNA-directed RNA polymerase specialized sigma24 family protein